MGWERKSSTYAAKELVLLIFLPHVHIYFGDFFVNGICFILRSEKLNIKKIIAVIDAIFAVAKRKHEKNSGLYRIRSLNLCDTGTELWDDEQKSKISKITNYPLSAWLFKDLFQLRYFPGHHKGQFSVSGFFLFLACKHVQFLVYFLGGFRLLSLE